MADVVIVSVVGTKPYDADYEMMVARSPNNTGVVEWLANMETRGRKFRESPVDVADGGPHMH